MNEEDVKIYSSQAEEQKSSPSGDIEKVLENMREHRNNGNLRKAKELGRTLGRIKFDFEELVSQKFIKPDIIYQMKVLFVFSAEANLQIFVYDPLLYTTAINSMYEEIQKHEEGFYKNISDGVAYSFYYSEMKKGGDIALNIGKAFAMLCSAQNNDSFIETGSRLYGIFADRVKAEIDSTQFRLI